MSIHPIIKRFCIFLIYLFKIPLTELKEGVNGGFVFVKQG